VNRGGLSARASGVERRRAAAVEVAPLLSPAAAKRRGRGTRGLGSSTSPAHLGLLGSREAGPREAVVAAVLELGRRRGSWWWRLRLRSLKAGLGVYL